MERQEQKKSEKKSLKRINIEKLQMPTEKKKECEGEKKHFHM